MKKKKGQKLVHHKVWKALWIMDYNGLHRCTILHDLKYIVVKNKIYTKLIVPRWWCLFFVAFPCQHMLHKYISSSIICLTFSLVDDFCIVLNIFFLSFWKNAFHCSDHDSSSAIYEQTFQTFRLRHC